MISVQKPIAGSSRKGFSLVELMVAMALIIFMLSIMSQAFVIATTCMQGLKGVGELLDKGRPVLAIMQKDLSAYHFDGLRRLSDDNFWENGPPSQGYFYISQGGLSEVEGTTLDGVTYQVSGQIPTKVSDHRLAFTSRLSGKNPEDFFVTPFENYAMAAVPSDYTRLTGLFNSSNALKTSRNSERYDFVPGILHSNWAEIAYFTKANSKNVNGVPLMDLYRQQKVVLPSTVEANGLQVDSMYLGKYEDFCCRVVTVANANPPPPAKPIVYFNSPAELTVPANRMALGVPFTNKPSSDLLLTDLISFDVRVLQDSSLQDFSLLSNILRTSVWPIPAPPPTDYSGYNRIFNTSPLVFDTWTKDRMGGVKYDLGDSSTGKWQPAATDATRIPIWNYQWNGSQYIPVKGLRINAIQVSIRIWDEKSQKAREFKLIQRL